MKLLSKLLISNAFVVLISQVGYAQKLDKEVTKDISNKAKRGFLSRVETNESARTIDMYFTVKSKSDKVKFEKYTFDYDLNFIKDETEELDVASARTKYKVGKHLYLPTFLVLLAIVAIYFWL